MANLENFFLLFLLDVLLLLLVCFEGEGFFAEDQGVEEGGLTASGLPETNEDTLSL